MLLLLLARTYSRRTVYADIVMEIVQPKQQNRCPEAGNLVAVQYKVYNVDGTPIK